MKNILFIGLGSIGQRHLRNLKKISKNYKFFAVRKNNESPELNSKNKVIKKKFLSTQNDVTEISEKKSMNIEFHAVFICNPSSMHVGASLAHAKKASHLFIEKPLSNNMRNIKKLKQLIQLKKIKCAVGFQLRYHPLLKKIKDLINSNKLGKIKKAYLKNSHYLPYHHKYEDYRKGYAANNFLGGGVILCFIHEIDYANYLFNKPLSIACEGGKKSKLKIDVEDHAKLKVNYKIKKNNFFAHIDLDFIEKKEKRFCKIIFEKGIVYWDLKKDLLIIDKYKKFKIKIKSPFNTRNDLFLKEVNEVMKNFKDNTKPKSNLENGISSLVLALAAKKSMRVNKTIKLGSFL